MLWWHSDVEHGQQQRPLDKRSFRSIMLHSPRIRWRTAFSYAAAIFVIMAGLVFILARQLDVAFGEVTGPVLGAALLIVLLMVYQAERAARTVRNLTGIAEQIAGGDLNPRIRSYSSGEIGQLARAFNRMADKLQKQIQKRAREKERLNTVLHALTDGVLLVNRQREVRLLNPAAAEILHISSDHAHKRTVTQAVRDHRIVEVFHRCCASGESEVAMFETENGRMLRVAAVPYLKGGHRGHVIILQDLTRLHQLQTVRQDFISNLSHELRTPIASLRALVDTLSDGALDDPPAAQRFLQRMEVELDALTVMVQELLELAHIESGHASLRLQELPAAAVVGLGAERLRPQIARAQLTLTYDLPEELPHVLVDPERIQQVVSNLVQNAIKFTPAPGSITLRAVHDQTADEVVVSVRDTGVGIAPDHLSRIFERFYKADRARASGGTGLGLAIAKHVVQAHGGRIWAESTLGKGSVFYFTLPASTGQTADATAVATINPQLFHVVENGSTANDPAPTRTPAEISA